MQGWVHEKELTGGPLPAAGLHECSDLIDLPAGQGRPFFPQFRRLQMAGILNYVQQNLGLAPGGGRQLQSSAGPVDPGHLL